MDAATSPPASERRRYPRRARRLDVVLIGAGGAEMPAESIDVSVGGMRVRMPAQIDLGPVRVVVADDLALEGMVLEEQIELDTGSVVARIAFVATGPAQREALAEVAGLTPRRSRRTLVTALVVAAALVAAVVVAALSRQDDSPDAAVLPTVVERADSTLTVSISEDPAQSYGTSTVGPSAGVDPVRIQVLFEPVPTADGANPVSVLIENRTDAPLVFGDGGAVATIEIRGDDGEVTTVRVEDPSVTELAPGAIIALDGAVRLEPGTYTLDAAAEVVAEG